MSATESQRDSFARKLRSFHYRFRKSDAFSCPGNYRRFVWRSLGLLAILLATRGVSAGESSDAKPLPPDLGQLNIEGEAIERLTLRKRGPLPLHDGTIDPLVFDHPGRNVSLPVADYDIQRVEIRGGYYCYGGPQVLAVRSDKPSRLRIGGPLTPTVSAARDGRYLSLAYALVDADGHIYGRKNVEGSAGNRHGLLSTSVIGSWARAHSSMAEAPLAGTCGKYL